MFYEFPAGERPAFTPPQGAAPLTFPRTCPERHARAKHPEAGWYCYLEEGHTGSHVAVLIASENVVCAVWDERRSTDSLGLSEARVYIPGGLSEDRRRPMDFVSGHPADGVCGESNTQGWICTRDENHSGLHIATGRNETLAMWEQTSDQAPEPQAAADEPSRPLPGSAQERLDALWAALDREARERGWCDEYDEFAKAHGGPPRTRFWSASVRLEVAVPLSALRAGETDSSAPPVRVQHDILLLAVKGATEEDARRAVPSALRAAGWAFSCVISATLTEHEG